MKQLKTNTFETSSALLVANFCVQLVAKSSALLLAKNSALLLTDYKATTMSEICLIYTTGRLDLKGLRNSLSKHLSLKQTSISFFENDLVTLSIIKNSDYDEIREREFPDGFLFFKYIIELQLQDSNKDEYIAYTSRILLWLWNNKLPSVASCDYEDQLPFNGGYKSLSVPWPKTDE